MVVWCINSKLSGTRMGEIRICMMNYFKLIFVITIASILAFCVTGCEKHEKPVVVRRAVIPSPLPDTGHVKIILRNRHHHHRHHSKLRINLRRTQ